MAALYAHDILMPMADTTTKIILVVIALGLWANVAIPLMKPVPVRAFDDNDIGRLVRSMEGDLSRIQRGTCANGKIC
jgi:hypothetical protein